MTTALTTPIRELNHISSSFWRISVKRYHQMIQKGLLTTNDRLELLEGLLVKKMTVNPPHAFVTETIGEVFARLLANGRFVNSQQPITMQESEPEPDVFVVRGQRRDFAQSHPAPEDVALLVEVSDSTLQQDQTWKNASTHKREFQCIGLLIYLIVRLRCTWSRQVYPLIQLTAIWSLIRKMTRFR
ncbi:MAG: Uma2 family endonuclease [Chloroflexi bacterium]|nr:Uma2 family endonuclease [Chloroflexota bacterium]